MRSDIALSRHDRVRGGTNIIFPVSVVCPDAVSDGFLRRVAVYRIVVVAIARASGSRVLDPCLGTVCVHATRAGSRHHLITHAFVVAAVTSALPEVVRVNFEGDPDIGRIGAVHGVVRGGAAAIGAAAVMG